MRDLILTKYRFFEKMKSERFKAKKERYMVAARVALEKQNWRQLIVICEQILRLQEAEDRCQTLDSD
jgi:division protein CdvB (Snf7/Vps24/ESCRT-III family)